MRADGTVLELEAGGVALGIDPTVAYKGGQVQLQSGDRLLLFTDGLTEAAAGDALYGK